MDEVAFHREPPSNIPTLVTAFSGWIDAGEAATDAMRFLVRQLAAEPLATIDLEDFVDFTQVRPVVRLTAEGERTIRWPRSAFWLWQPPAPRAGLLLFRGLEPQRRWRTYATALLDVAARCGVQRIVSLGAMLADLPHTRPPRVTGSSTDPHWHAQLEAWGMARRSRYEGPTGIASVMLDAARRRGIASLTVMGQAPHYLQGTTNPAMRQALLTRWPACSTWSSMSPPSMQPCRPFGRAATRRWRRTPRPRPMSGNWSRPMTRRGTRRRAHAVTTPSTRSS